MSSDTLETPHSAEPKPNGKNKKDKDKKTKKRLVSVALAAALVLFGSWAYIKISHQQPNSYIQGGAFYVLRSPELKSRFDELLKAIREHPVFKAKRPIPHF
jgi:hypothetical protein